jgi:hypothetical protein
MKSTGLFFTLITGLLFNTQTFSQPKQEMIPMIGAEIFIEPGQTPEEIYTWCRLIKENGMTICRIRMFETYMHKPDDNWDFSLFDLAYKAAEKYEIKVWGSLFPATDFTGVGGFKFPRSEDHEPGSHLHVNNHAIFQNMTEYDFPEWRKFLKSLGGSAHASWHFSYFKRNQYAVAMSANCKIIRSGAGTIPWLMTEIQGGNNTYSGFNAMCPTREEISQWLWIVIGSGGKGGIFWTLNPRASGFEAGELKEIDEFDFSKTDYTETAIILVHHHENPAIGG